MSTSVESKGFVQAQTSEAQVIRRASAAVALGGIAVIHALDLQSKLDELPYVGVMFIVLIVTSVVLAAALIHTNVPRVWMAAGALAAATILGYAISRTTGLPGDHDGDVGNWLEPLGLTSLIVEGFVVLLAAGALLTASSEATLALRHRT
jgi:hypothetical protein